jgi:DNA processing protein
VIIEAGDASGTLHQAAECVRLGRWLFIAKNLMEDPSLKWPAGFKHYSNLRTLTSTSDILGVLSV